MAMFCLLPYLGDKRDSGGWVLAQVYNVIYGPWGEQSCDSICMEAI